MKFVLCLVLSLSILSLSYVGHTSVPEATAHGAEVHESVLRKIFVKTSEFLNYINNLSEDEKAKEQKEMEETCGCMGIRG